MGQIESENTIWFTKYFAESFKNVFSCASESPISIFSDNRKSERLNSFLWKSQLIFSSPPKLWPIASGTTFSRTLEHLVLWTFQTQLTQFNTLIESINIPLHFRCDIPLFYITQSMSMRMSSLCFFILLDILGMMLCMMHGINW